MAVAVDPASLETLDSDALIEVRELLAQVMELLEALRKALERESSSRGM
jgi:hypothetical protein